MTAPEPPRRVRCRAPYPSQPWLSDPDARIVRCNLPWDHRGDHDELVDGEAGIVTWPAEVVPAALISAAEPSNPQPAAKILPERTADPGQRGPLPPVPEWAYGADATPLEVALDPLAPAIEAAAVAIWRALPAEQMGTWEAADPEDQAEARQLADAVVHAAAPIIAAQAVAAAQTCTCQAWPPEGPSPECAVHGAVRAFNEMAARLAEVERERDEARARLAVAEDNLAEANALLDDVNGDPTALAQGYDHLRLELLRATGAALTAEQERDELRRHILDMSTDG